MPQRMVHLDDDTLEHLEQIARILHVSPERAIALCIHDAYRSLPIGQLVAD